MSESVSAAKTCTFCETEIPDGAQDCPTCGAPVVAEAPTNSDAPILPVRPFDIQ